MRIDTLHVAGFAPAFHAMRNPKDSWAKSDSEIIEMEEGHPHLEIGPKD